MRPPPNQVALATRYGKQYGVDPRLLLAIGGHETGFGTLGAGRQGYTLGYGVTDSGILNKYQGIEAQYRWAAETLAKWGVHSLADVLAGKASAYATDPLWEKGVARTYASLGGGIPATVPSPPGGSVPAAGALPPVSIGSLPPVRPSTPLNPGELARINAGFQVHATPAAAGSFKLKTPTFSQPVPRAPSVAPGPQHAAPASPVGNNLATIAAAQLGQPYIWGAESRKEGGFDCSGLVDWALRQQGYTGPRTTTWTIARMGRSVKGQPLQPGDLVLANNNQHVVIYAGNGRVIAAPHKGEVVQYQPISKFRITDVRRL